MILSRPFFERLHVVRAAPLERDVAERAVARQLRHRREREVRVHRADAVADEERQVRDLARLAGLEDDARADAQPLAHQVVVHRAHAEQRRDRRVALADVAIAQRAGRRRRGRALDLLRTARAGASSARSSRLAALRVGESQHQRRGVKVRDGVLPQLGEIHVGQHRVRQLDHPTLPGRLLEQVALAADAADERHDDLLADRIDRRVRHLREVLLEVAEERLRACRRAPPAGISTPIEPIGSSPLWAIGPRSRRTSSSV